MTQDEKITEACLKSEQALKEIQEIKQNSSPSNAVLANMLENLTEQVKVGMSGIHDRQDKTNGNVSRNKVWIENNRFLPKIVYGTVTIILIEVAYIFLDNLVLKK